MTSWRGIWELAWPLVLTMVLNAGIGLWDAWIAGRYDPASQAAVGLTNQLVFLIGSAVTAASIGCQALVSRYVGADDWEGAGTAAQQALILGLAFSVALVVPMWICTPQLYALMGAPPEVVHVGTGYLRTALVAFVPMDAAILINSVFRARGRTVALLIANAAEAGLWAVTSGALGLEAGWGLRGLACGFVAGKLAGFGVALALFRRSRVYRHMPRSWRPSSSWFRRILDVGVPAGFQVVVRNVAMIAYFGVLERLPSPTQAVAALTVGLRIESVAYLPVFALNIATATLVGQNLGAGQPAEAARAAWRVAWVGVAIMATAGLFFFLAADPLAASFTQDPLVRGYAASYLRIVGASEPLLALVMVLNGGLTGAGATRPPLAMTFTAQICFRLPLAYVLAIRLGQGPDGAWWAMTWSMVVQSILVVSYFQLGGWRTRQI